MALVENVDILGDRKNSSITNLSNIRANVGGSLGEKKFSYLDSKEWEEWIKSVE